MAALWNGALVTKGENASRRRELGSNRIISYGKVKLMKTELMIRFHNIEVIVKSFVVSVEWRGQEHNLLK